MPTTPALALPYPALPDTPDTPYWAQQLAERSETVMLTLAVAPLPDNTFPVTVTNITAETVIDRFTIAAAPYARRILMDCNAYVTVSVANTQANLVLYAGVNVIGYGRKNIAGVGATNSDELVATGRYDLPANTAVVLEARVARQAGPGTVSTSNSSALTNTNVQMLRR